jgi:hypothetical protein
MDEKAYMVAVAHPLCGEVKHYLLAGSEAEARSKVEKNRCGAEGEVLRVEPAPEMIARGIRNLNGLLEGRITLAEVEKAP